MPEDNKLLHIIFEQKEDKERKIESYWNLQRIDLVKWLLGTFLLGLVGIFINSQIQQTELKLKGMEVDGKLIDAVSTKFDTSEIAQYRYLKYIQPFITTDSLKVAVQRAIDTLFKKLNNVREEIGREVNRSKSELEKKLSPEQMIKLNRQSQIVLEKNNDQQPIEEYKKVEDEIVGATKSIDSVAVQNIEEAKLITTPKVEANYVLLGHPQTLWCKKGYYVVFNNSLRIGINSLDNSSKTIVVNFKDVENEKEDRLLVGGKATSVLTVGSPFELKYNQYKYIISLDYIGAAGKNPLTKAAYITVATYKKS